MPPEIAQRAFDAFFTTKPAGRGTGLGLSQVQTVARLSHGGARIKSAPDEGTEVQLWLASERDQSRRQGGSGDAPDLLGRGEKLLIVDDEPDIRRTLAELLRGQGYDVVTAASGEEGLAVLPDAKPALMLLDFFMPGISGLEVARRVRHLQPDLPVLFVTAFADRALLKAQFPQHRILAKPFKSEDLFAAVAEGLRRERLPAG